MPEDLFVGKLNGLGGFEPIGWYMGDGEIHYMPGKSEADLPAHMTFAVGYVEDDDA